MSWPKVDWLPGNTREPLYDTCGGLGDYDDTSHPKLLLHTTEGYSIATSEAAYRNGHFAPHETVGPASVGGKKIDVHQHFPYSSRSTTLEDPSGGLRTNREGCIQVEIVGFCDPKFRSSWLYIPNWPQWYLEQVADHLLDICHMAGIPVDDPGIVWADYPGSYGLDAKQRLSDAQYRAHTGILAHQHAPENVHGDAPLQKLVELMKARNKPPAPTPQPKPQPAPAVKEPVVATRRMSTDDGDKQPLPRSKYHTIRFGKNDKGALVSALGPGDDYDGSFTATVSLWIDAPKGFDHIEILPYMVDTKTLKVARVLPVAPIGSWHVRSIYRVHAVFDDVMDPGQRLRFQVRSDYKSVTVIQAAVNVKYDKKAA